MTNQGFGRYPGRWLTVACDVADGVRGFGLYVALAYAVAFPPVAFAVLVQLAQGR